MLTMMLTRLGESPKCIAYLPACAGSTNQVKEEDSEQRGRSTGLALLFLVREGENIG